MDPLVPPACGSPKLIVHSKTVNRHFRLAFRRLATSYTCSTVRDRLLFSPGSHLMTPATAT
jgi:hypothetical protein